jgi:hypothetical protein
VFISRYSSVAAGRKRSTQQHGPVQEEVLQSFGATSACMAALVAPIHINGIQNQFSTALIMVVVL